MGEIKKEKNLNIILVGNVGNLGTKILIENKKDLLLKNFSSQFLNFALKNINDDFKNNEKIFLFLENLYKERSTFEIENIVSFIDKRDPKNKHFPDYKSIDKNIKYAIFKIEKGGILATLYIALKALGLGVEYNLREIPIRQETIEICDFFDLDPYRLMSKDVFLVFVKDENIFYKDLGDIIFKDEYYFYNNKNHLIKKIGNTLNNNKKIRIDISTNSTLTKDFKDELDKVIDEKKI